MRIDRLTPADATPPIGAYPHLVRISGDIDWVFISGQVGLDSSGEMPGDVYSQTRNVYLNIERLLASQGLSPNSIVKFFTVLVDSAHLAEYRRARDEIYAEWFAFTDITNPCASEDAAYSGFRPGSSLIIAAALARKDVLIEVDGWAVAPRNTAIEGVCSRDCETTSR